MRVVNCAQEAGLRTVGELRGCSEPSLMQWPHFGVTSRDNVRWFFNWTRQLESGNGELPGLKSFLREFLSRHELHVLEQRYGLTDRLFRPQLKRRTLAEIAHEMRGGLTRERVRQIEETAVRVLRARLPASLGEKLVIYWSNRILDSGCVVTSAELSQWSNDPQLGGYQPWGALLLLSETYERINFRYDYFTTLPAQVLNQFEKQILQLLHAERAPVAFEKILASVSEDLSFLNGQRPRLVSVMLDHHPEISGTTDRRYFLPSVGAPIILTDILNATRQPLHFHELTRLYNQLMQPNSRKGTGYILRTLNLMTEAQRVERALYQLKDR